MTLLGELLAQLAAEPWRFELEQLMDRRALAAERAARQHELVGVVTVSVVERPPYPSGSSLGSWAARRAASFST